MPDQNDTTLLDDLRRYGEATEAAAGRYGTALADYPVGANDGRRATAARRGIAIVSPAGTASVDPAATPSREPGRRRVVLVVAAAALVLAVVASLAVARRTDGSAPAVDTPATTPVPTAEPFDDGTVLVWFPYDAPPQLLARGADRPVPLEIGEPSQPGTGGIATTSPTAAFLVGGSMFMLVRDGTVIPTGVAADRVLGDRNGGVFYAYASGVLSRYDPSVIDAEGNRPDQASLPAWQLPAGWRLANDGVGVAVVDGRVILEGTDPTSGIQDIAVWTPATGELTPIGRAWWVVDATTYPDGTPLVAWVDDDCDALSTGCGLVVTDLDTMESRAVARPEHGYIGGGAFSDDGRRLAVFVAGQENMPVNPSADLAVVDLDSLEMRVLPGTNMAVGEAYGSAAWTLDNGSVIYHGLSPTRVVDVTTGEQRTLPWEITYSMATIP